MQNDFPITIVLRELERDGLLPAILFRTSRRQCDEDLERILKNRRSYLPKEKQEHIRALIEEVADSYGMDKEIVCNHPQYESLCKTGIGAHHAGQLLLWRLVLEELMSKGELRILVATGTVAAGVDFPARTVIVTAHSRRGNEGYQVLSSSEFQQMSGRAGRRGKDAVGICLVAPSPFSDARVLAQVALKPPEPLKSSYFASPSTVLNLLKHRSSEELGYTVSKSLAAFCDNKEAEDLILDAQAIENELESLEQTPETKKQAKKARRLRNKAQKLKEKQINILNISLQGLSALGHINEDGRLTDKGSFAAELRTSLVLELAEAIDAHIFSNLANEELIALVACIAGDSYRTYFKLRRNPIKKEYFDAMQKAVAKVKNSYEGSEFASDVEVQPDAALTLLTWIESTDWKEFSGLLKLSGVAEGDAARLILQTADHLSQIARLTESYPEIARQAEEARLLILRPPITDGVFG